MKAEDSDNLKQDNNNNKVEWNAEKIHHSCTSWKQQTQKQRH